MNFLRKLFGRKELEFVRYYDPTTKTVVRISKAELRPGVVLVKVRGDSEPMYADAAELKINSTPYHSSLSEELRSDIAKLAAELADVCPRSTTDWEEGFKRDRDPTYELAGWLHAAAILRAMTVRQGYDVARRGECFRVLVACFTGGRDTVRERADVSLLSASEVEQVIHYFFEGGYS